MDGAPLERLNFHDGMRLAASDLRVEQAYHIRVPRLLNQALFDPGIAKGLQVAVKPGDPHTVVVSPGVALDGQGREIILRQPRDVPAAGVPSRVPGSVYGNYLVIQYAEAPVSPMPARRNGRPPRLRAEPRLGWRPSWPRPGDGQVVLVQAELSADCAVRRLDGGVRTSVIPRGAERATAVAIYGAEDIDQDDPEDLYFHLRGSRPDKVVLYLRGGVFSSLFYSQLGSHTHPTTLQISDETKRLRHIHVVASGTTGPAKPPRHNHRIRMQYGDRAAGADEHTAEPDWVDRWIDLAGNHVHGFEDMNTEQELEESWKHAHRAEKVVVDKAGASDQAATSHQRLGYVDDLRVRIDNADLTDRLLAQLRDRDGPGSWKRLGDGSDAHPLVTEGTGELDLLRLGVDLAPGEHRLRLSVPASPAGEPANGGRIHYNLYLE